ncbi:MAG: helix-turn-helix transcriptional regulator [Rhizobiaceae bacterium]|nr:helix-turn-helix transcriptional regulator [Rhizobiaceae bacterium]
MLSHDRIWAAIDALAQDKRLTPSGLARRSGLDPTSFNKSKRVTNSNRLRWPSTESVSKALNATNTTLAEFLSYVQGEKIDTDENASNLLPTAHLIPLLGMAQAGVGGFFDDGGFPAGQGWDEIDFPRAEHDSIYALEVSGDSMLPLFRDGDVLIVAPNASVRKGDRVVVKTLEGEVMAKILQRKTARTVELLSLNREHEDRKFDIEELEWVARIIWASQ